MTISKKHLNWLVDHALIVWHDPGGPSRMQALNFIRDFGVEFCPGFDEVEFWERVCQGMGVPPGMIETLTGRKETRDV